MDVVGTLLSAVQTLFASLQCSDLRELCSILGYKSELADLERTVNTIKAVLLDAESNQMEVELTHQAKLWIDELKDALHDADDLVDEFLTLGRQKKLMMGGNFTQKVRGLRSRYNSLAIARKISKGVREITKRLDAIAKNHNQFGCKLDCQPMRQRRVETCSYVSAQDIVGREDDLKKIVGRLLDPHAQRDETSCLSIVGIGGLGKTTLAQLIYNDMEIQREFPLILWTCISDEKVWDLEVILRKILKSTKDRKGSEDLLRMSYLSMDHLQSELRGELVQKKYLIVLDDIWTEDRDKWITLMGFLRGGLRGSWVIATTRSKITATIIGGEIHDLKGLSDEDSWKLFEKVAFGQDHDEQVNRIELDEIGQAIVKKHCANVPLAIRVAGSALYGQDKKNWLWFLEVGLRRVMKGAEGIEPILKLSYLHLDPPLRICFSYCALFAKDQIIQKHSLINLWIAHGNVVPCDEAQSIEDTAEEYLLVLLKRCFFQCLETNKDGEIISFLVHDLMHDIAQQVAGEEIVGLDSPPSNWNNKIRHLFHCDQNQGTKSLFTGSTIRTYLGVGACKPESPVELGTVLAKWRSLRVLDLSYSEMKNLPITLGKLLHLRYLDLSWSTELEVLPNVVTRLNNLQVLYLDWCKRLKGLPNDLGKLASLRALHLSHNNWVEVLPDSITKLQNLYILNLTGCTRLRELPSGLSELTSLRVLDTTECKSLFYIPRGIGKLNHLRKLPRFVLGAGTSSTKEDGQLADHLEEIKALRNLKGSLHVHFNIPDNAKCVGGNGEKESCLSQYLTEIAMIYRERECSEIMRHLRYPATEVQECWARVHDIDEKLLERLQPHPNLTKLKLDRYGARIMPNWARGEKLTISLPNLVSIELQFCSKLIDLPVLGKLAKLKYLVLSSLGELEYIENTTMARRNGIGDVEDFFPSLEQLRLSYLRKLKGWWRDDGNNSTQEDGGLLLPSFPCLRHLVIDNCPNLALASMPLFPNLAPISMPLFLNLATTSLPLCFKSRRLEITKSSNVNLRIKSGFLWGSLETDSVEILKLEMFTEAIPGMQTMVIRGDKKIEKLAEAEDVFRSCSSSLQWLEIMHCHQLKSLCGGLEHLTALKILSLINLPNLSLSKAEGEGQGGGEEDDMRVWRCIGHSLETLTLGELPKMVELPSGMRFLTALQTLRISNCVELESIPEWMPNLISLKELVIGACSNTLKQRCRRCTGEDWPYIKHIASFRISDYSAIPDEYIGIYSCEYQDSSTVAWGDIIGEMNGGCQYSDF